MHKTCEVCGGPAPASERCTNGRCGKCHAKHCTPGGATGPGHGRGSPVYAYRMPSGKIVLSKSRNFNFEVRDDVKRMKVARGHDAQGTPVAYVDGFAIYEP